MDHANDVADDDDAASQPAPLALSTPTYLGAHVDPDLRLKLHALLAGRDDQLGEVYRAMTHHPTPVSSIELQKLTSCRNSSIVANRRVVVHAVFNGTVPPGPTVALQAASSVRTLLKATTDDDVVRHLSAIEHGLAQQASSEAAVSTETVQLKTASASLVQEMKDAAGVYVFTYPHYWRHPYVADTERRLLKVGRTGTKSWNRVLSQARLTAMPEDPILLRVYESSDPVASETTFHALLDAAEHQRSAGVTVGAEWFVTTLDFCDTIGDALGLHVHRNDEVTE